MNEIANALQTAACVGDMLNFQFSNECLGKLGDMVISELPYLNFNKPAVDVVKPNFWTTSNFYFYAFMASIIANFVLFAIIRRIRK